MGGEELAGEDGTGVWGHAGWSGGGYGVGQGTSIKHPRAMVRAALDGTRASVAASTDPHFGMQVPSACPDVPGNALAESPYFGLIP